MRGIGGYNSRVNLVKRIAQPVLMLFSLLLVLLSSSACGVPVAVAKSPSAATVTSKPAQPQSQQQIDGLAAVKVVDLPRDAQRTVALVQEGGPFPLQTDGAIFQNRERRLPSKPHGYYREYAVLATNQTERGPRRIVVGEGGEFYYTADRFVSFVRVMLSTTTQSAAATATPRPRTPRTIDGFRVVMVNELPREAQRTILLIQRGGPYPFERDGIVFQNRERILPQKPRGYYREYTVITPGEDDRGARRIIAGQGGELYYTADHYETFVRVVLI
jgi:ribonuclease T1